MLFFNKRSFEMQSSRGRERLELGSPPGPEGEPPVWFRNQVLAAKKKRQRASRDVPLRLAL